MEQPQPAARLIQGFSELDIPLEWRNDLFANYGEAIGPFSDEESEAVELDRR